MTKTEFSFLKTLNFVFWAQWKSSPNGGTAIVDLPLSVSGGALATMAQI
ncbi:hypothetical protein [Parasedimentitalea denitrificans]|nr:hypothetical protein [Sedimentitalea sp. CY04]